LAFALRPQKLPAPWQAPPAAAAMIAAAAMKPRRDAFGSSLSGDTDVCSLAMGVLLGGAGSDYYGTDARVPDVAQRVTQPLKTAMSMGLTIHDCVPTR